MLADSGAAARTSDGYSPHVTDQPKLYTQFAGWFHLLTAPADYEEEARLYTRLLQEAAEGPVSTVLELGSGGGNNASHMKQQFTMTLSDLSPAMLQLSEKLNPECEHIEGDMRTLRLGRTFDAVFIHDAVSYLLTMEEIAAMIDTAVVHCRPGGSIVIVPDDTAETWSPRTDDGGHDGEDGRGLRYLSWTHSIDTTTHIAIDEMVYILRRKDGSVEVVHDRHHFGAFPEAEWLSLLARAGLEVRIERVTWEDDWSGTVFVCHKPA